MVVLSSVHEALDPRIFHKEARTLAAAGFDVHLLARAERSEVRDGVRIQALPQPRGRWERPWQWWRLAWATVRLGIAKKRQELAWCRWLARSLRAPDV